MIGRRHRRFPFSEDSANLARTVSEFNHHDGPARIFYNRNTETFYVNTYEPGSEAYFGELLDCYDSVELYRKEDGKVQVTREELLYLEDHVVPFRQF